VKLLGWGLNRRKPSLSALCLAAALFHAHGQNLDRPVWVDRAPDPDHGRTFFVGRSSLLDSADEKKGVQQALDDVFTQVSKTTGVRLMNAEAATGSALAGQAGTSVITGLRQEAKFAEYSRGEKRFKYHLLVSVPEDEIARLENKAKTDAGTRLESLMAAVQSALGKGDLQAAREPLAMATKLYPHSDAAWMALAEVHEKTARWDLAFSTWETLAKHSPDPKIRNLAQAALIRTTDELALDRLGQAELKANSPKQALELLQDAAMLKPSSRVLDRVRNRHLEITSKWLSTEIGARASSNGWKVVGVNTFAATTEAAGSSIRDRLWSSLAQDSLKPKLLSLSEKGVRGLSRGSVAGLPDEEHKAVETAGVDAVVFGEVGDALISYVYSVKSGELYPLPAINLIGAVPDYPQNTEVWMRLPQKGSTSRGLRLEVWTEKRSYRIGEPVVFYMRSNKDCHVVLMDVRTSGGLYVLLPNPYQMQTRLPAGQVLSVPAKGNGEPVYEIYESGPVGVEGVKAVAAIEPILLADGARSEPIREAKKPEEQAELCERILTQTGTLKADDWDVSDWTFEVTR
jgi:hypothetical protein